VVGIEVKLGAFCAAFTATATSGVRSVGVSGGLAGCCAHVEDKPAMKTTIPTAAVTRVFNMFAP
jgi:hypothetical protein